MRTVNYHYLSLIVGPLNTVRDSEVSHIVSPDDEDGIRQIIRLRIVPEFASLDDDSRMACKDALSYFLTTGNAPFYEILSSQQEWQIDPPTDPKQFFIWTWKELFPSEDYQIDDTASWEECNDASKAFIHRSR